MPADFLGPALNILCNLAAKPLPARPQNCFRVILHLQQFVVAMCSDSAGTRLSLGCWGGHTCSRPTWRCGYARSQLAEQIVLWLVKLFASRSFGIRSCCAGLGNPSGLIERFGVVVIPCADSCHCLVRKLACTSQMWMWQQARNRAQSRVGHHHC